MGEYHDLQLRSDVLLLAKVFQNFRKMCIRIYELDHIKVFSAHGLVWQVALKKMGVEIALLTDADMLLMVEKGIRIKIYHVIHH